MLIKISVSSTNSEDVISSSAKVRNYIENFNSQNENSRLEVLTDASETLNGRNRLLIEKYFPGYDFSINISFTFFKLKASFLGSFGLPVSFLGMFIFAPLVGVTINVLSTFGMIIVIGILVDDGIVIAENIYQQYEKGKTPYRAAIDGVLEVIPPVVSAIITTMMAFSLFLFLDGRIGEFFSEVSVVVMLTLLSH